MSRACSPSRSIFGMALPGTMACGLRSQAIMLSGVLRSIPAI